MTELAIELHRLLLQAALQRRLLLPLLRAASGDTSLTIPAENDNQNR